MASSNVGNISKNGELPSGWRMVQFGDVVRDIKESERNPLEAGLDRYIGLEHIEPENLHIKEWGDLTQDDVSFTKRFREGQVLFGKRRAYQRKVALAEFDGICSSDILTFEPKDDSLTPELLPFIVQSHSFFNHALGTSSGSLSPRTRWSQLKDFVFPLPPTDKQREIAETLVAAKECVGRHACVVSTVERSWQALMDSVIPGPESDHSDSVKTLQDVCEMQNGRPFPSKNYEESGYKLLRPGNLAPGGRLDWSEGATVYLGSEHVENNPDHIVRPGDVVINLTAQSLEDGFMGRVCLAVNGDESLLNQRLGRFICKGEASSEYLFRVLQTTRFRRLVESRCEGSKVCHTYFRHFAKMPIVVLDRKAEEVVVEKARQIDRARDSAIAAENSSRELLVRLREHLLGGAAER